jgi:hypothetical protein
MSETELRQRVRNLETENSLLREQLLRVRDLQLSAEHDVQRATERAHKAEAEAAQTRLQLRELEARNMMHPSLTLSRHPSSIRVVG